jgi:uncharacterized protein YecE (DUF72 family)
MYGSWRGPVYPPDLPKRRWFAHYASQLDTVELNSTFYRLPAESTVRSWGAAAPEGFVYSLKLGAFGSHRMKLRDAASWLPNHVERFSHLGPSLGPTLVQLPPRWRRDAARLDEMLSVAPTAIAWAVELREPSWLDDEVFDVLSRHGAALCVHDMLDEHPFVATTDWVYVRMHGPGAPDHPYRGRYGRTRLRALAHRLAAEIDAGRGVYCYFNNDSDGDAFADARWLADALGVALDPAPRDATPEARRAHW